MARLIEGEQVDGLSSEVGSEHAAADIDSDQVGNDGIGDPHRGPNSAPEAKVRVGHDGRVRALRERHVEHAADLLDARVLYVNGVACRRAVFSLDGKHERSFPSNLHASRLSLGLGDRMPLCALRLRANRPKPGIPIQDQAL